MEMEERRQEREIVLRQAEKYNREMERDLALRKKKNDQLKAERQQQVKYPLRGHVKNVLDII